MELNTNYIWNNIGEFLDTDAMRGYMHEYAASHRELEGIDTIGDLNRVVFSTPHLYAGFLQFMQERNFGQKIYSPMQNINFILACERIAIEMGTIKNSISEILDLSYVAVIGGMKERYIPGTPVDFFNALRTSSNRNMILNEKGEVCYHIRLKGDIFQVYSRQSGIHYINGFGGIIDLDETYQLRQNNLLILREETIKLLGKMSDQESLNIDLENPFIKSLYDDCMRDMKTEEDPKIIFLRFRFWLRNEIAQIDSDLRVLRRNMGFSGPQKL